MIIMSDLKTIFKTPTPLQVAATELAQAELELLKAETGVEFASSLVTFNKQRVTRLRSYIKAQARELAKEDAS